MPDRVTFRVRWIAATSPRRIATTHAQRSQVRVFHRQLQMVSEHSLDRHGNARSTAIRQASCAVFVPHRSPAAAVAPTCHHEGKSTLSTVKADLIMMRVQGSATFYNRISSKGRLANHATDGASVNHPRSLKPLYEKVANVSFGV
jgi:hypothetical protein